MTLAVAKLTHPVAASQASTASATPAADDGESITTGDFASLLLSQLTSGIPPTTALAVAKSDDKTTDIAATESMTPMESAQLFASLGLPVPPSGQALPAARGPADGDGASDKAATTLALDSGELAPTTTSLNANGNPGAGTAYRNGAAIQTSATDTAVSADVPPRESLPAGPDTSFAAKLAGASPESAIQPGLTDEAPVAAPTAPNGIHVAHTATAAQQQPVADSDMQIPTPVRDAAWPADFSQKVVWMTRQDLQSAQITLNPPQMGPIEISLDVKNDQASAVFVSANAEVREVIESALPRLREMLANAGIELGQANVSHESSRQASEQNGGNARRESGNGNRAMGDDSLAASIHAATPGAGGVRGGNGLVDTFA